MTVIRSVLLYETECWTVRKEEEQILESVDIRKELGVNSIQEKVREMRLRWYGHMQRMEENNEVRAVVDMILPEKDQEGDQEGDGWIASEGICRNCGSPRRMPMTEHSGNQDFGPLIPSGGKRRRRRYIL